MTDADVTSLDLRIIESVLEMSGGYVLDLNNRSFADFFREHGIDIDAERFALQGSSKANRLRCFLRSSRPPLTGRVLAGLLEHRIASKPQGIRPQDLEAYGKVVARLGGEVHSADAGASADADADADAEAELLRRVFRPDLFAKLPVDAAMAGILVERLNEAQRCISAKAYLAAVILCGSVLEGMCLGYGSRNIERMNRAYLERFRKPARQLPDWRLQEWIDVLASLGDLSPNLEKFGHGLRDFRNYVHPAEQLARGFTPDANTARIAFQVVIAAAEDLVGSAAAGIKCAGSGIEGA
ncbi:MAG: hypothetical protein ACYDAN_12110 [Candidatus Limnocylindrales bacterium]